MTQLQVDNATWCTPDSDKKLTTTELLAWISSTRGFDPFKEFDLVVSSDSQSQGKVYRFVTVVCLYRHGKGGNYYFTVGYQPRQNYRGSQHTRIFEEVERSLGVAEHIRTKLGVEPIVHVDASPKNAGQFTSGFSDQLKGFATACGFETILKPDSFAACVANKHSR